MVFYFSATGNSKTIAEYVAREFDTCLIDIHKAQIDRKYKFILKEDEVVYFIFPVYYYTVPHQLISFIEEMELVLENGAAVCTNTKFCAIATCGSGSGKSKLTLSKALKVKGYNLVGFYQVEMPDFYLPLVKPPLPEEQTMICRRAKKTMQGIFEDIRYNFRVSHDMTTGGLILGVLGELVYRYGRPTKKFHVTDSCISCGNCSKVCVDGIITISDFDKPIWNCKRCTHCMACINRCPQGAIEYGKKVKGKGSYYTDTLDK